MWRAAHSKPYSFVCISNTSNNCVRIFCVWKGAANKFSFLRVDGDAHKQSNVRCVCVFLNVDFLRAGFLRVDVLRDDFCVLVFCD